MCVCIVFGNILYTIYSIQYIVFGGYKYLFLTYVLVPHPVLVSHLPNRFMKIKTNKSESRINIFFYYDMALFFYVISVAVLYAFLLLEFFT